MARDVETIKAVLRQNLIARRSACAMSQEQLALVADIDRTYVSQTERGRANPSIGTLCALSEALGCDVIDLLVDTATGSS